MFSPEITVVPEDAGPFEPHLILPSQTTEEQGSQQDSGPKGHEKAHGSAILPRPRMLTIPRAYGVFADHGRTIRLG